MAPTAAAAKAPKGRKGAKRSAEADGAPAPKRAKAVDPVAAMCDEVQQALVRAVGLPDSCREMLVAMVPGALGATRDSRHALQAKVVGMIGGAIAGIRGGLQEEVTGRKGRLDEVLGEKAALQQKKAEAEAAVGTNNEALAERQVARDEHLEKTSAAEASLAAARKAESEASRLLQTNSETKARCESALDGASKKVKVGEWDSESEAREIVRELGDFGKELAFDQSLLNGMPAAAVKRASDRGTFDVMIVEQFEGMLRQKVETLANDITAVDKATAGHTEAVTAAEQALAAAVAENATCDQAVSAAQAGVDESKRAVQAARKELLEVEKRIKEAQVSNDAAEAEVEVFKATAEVAFEKLHERDLTAPSPEPAAEPEAVAVHASEADAAVDAAGEPVDV